jgi:hypothetical protein
LTNSAAIALNLLSMYLAKYLLKYCSVCSICSICRIELTVEGADVEIAERWQVKLEGGGGEVGARQGQEGNDADWPPFTIFGSAKGRAHAREECVIRGSLDWGLLSSGEGLGVTRGSGVRGWRKRNEIREEGHDVDERTLVIFGNSLPTMWPCMFDATFAMASQYSDTAMVHIP